MKYFGKPAGMWAVFGGSFRRELVRCFGLSEQSAYETARKAKTFCGSPESCGGWCMDVYKVKIYPAAKRDLQQIVDYLNTLSAQVALRYYDLLVEQISSLSHMPFRCPRPRDAALAAKGYRYLLVEKYLVFYVVAGDTVQIRRILYARRNYQSVLADPMS